jgi:DNA-binding SARP family transcriptional activator/tetratricopeptide (TPR) repeat protein
VVGGLQFGVLGPLAVTRDGVPVPISRGRPRTLLAVLLLHPNRPVPLGHITERVWGDAPPAEPRRAVHTVVARLRQTLGGDLVQTHPAGYLIRLAADQLDLTRFTDLAAAAERAVEAGDTAGAHGLLGDALALWRGPALTDIRSDVLHARDVPPLVEQRRRVAAGWVQTGLRLGRYAEVVPVLRKLLGTDPLHERFWAQLMTALSRSGRPAEALEEYQAVRRRLADELGVDPSEELRQLYQAILGGGPLPGEPPEPEPAAAGPGEPPPAAGPAPEPRVVPRQLPPAVRGFTGRTAELAGLDALLDEHQGGGPGGPVMITAIAGTGGVGKTALAAQWARRVADRFPDGQLWLDLRGYDPDRPLTAGEALTVLLRALGIPGGQLPVEVEAQSGLYRSLLDGRRMLVVLDNASSPDQVRPLLPGAPGCLVLITSRDELAGLVARDGAARLRLDLLSEDDAIALLGRLLPGVAAAGAGRPDPGRPVLAELAGLCARLPLALRVAADRINSSDRPLAEAVAELAAEPRLDALAAGDDPHTAARAVLSWSYQALPPAAAVLFRRLGLTPVADWDRYAAAALVDGTLAEARRLLGVLAGAHLVEEHRGRYRMHDLLRAYAVEHAEAAEPEAARTGALTRLFDHYLGTAAAAMDAAVRYEKHRRPVVPPPPRPGAAGTDRAAAMAWLDAERANLVLVIVHAAGHGWPRHAVRLASTVNRYLLLGGHHSEALVAYQAALRAAVAGGDPEGEAVLLNNLGSVYWQLGRYGDAAGHYQQSLELRRTLGDRIGQGVALTNLGVISWMRGSYPEALGYYLQALPIHEEVGNRAGVATTLSNLGRLHGRAGRTDEAFDHHRRALAVYREIGDRSGEASTLISRGVLHLQRGELARAFEHFELAHAVYAEIGDRPGVGDALASLGSAHLRAGRPDAAFTHYRRALALARDMRHRDLEMTTLNALGEASLLVHNPADAAGYHQLALDLATEASDLYTQARALDGLGQAWRQLGQQPTARAFARRARDLFTELDIPHEDRLDADLSTAATPD